MNRDVWDLLPLWWAVYIVTSRHSWPSKLVSSHLLSILSWCYLSYFCHNTDWRQSKLFVILPWCPLLPCCSYLMHFLYCMTILEWFLLLAVFRLHLVFKREYCLNRSFSESIYSCMCSMWFEVASHMHDSSSLQKEICPFSFCVYVLLMAAVFYFPPFL